MQRNSISQYQASTGLMLASSNQYWPGTGNKAHNETQLNKAFQTSQLYFSTEQN